MKPGDAIPAAARLLAANGASGNLQQAIFTYNHSCGNAAQAARPARSGTASPEAAAPAPPTPHRSGRSGNGAPGSGTRTRTSTRNWHKQQEHGSMARRAPGWQVTSTIPALPGARTHVTTPRRAPAQTPTHARARVSPPHPRTSETGSIRVRSQSEPSWPGGRVGRPDNRRAGKRDRDRDRKVGGQREARGHEFDASHTPRIRHAGGSEIASAGRRAVISCLDLRTPVEKPNFVPSRSPLLILVPGSGRECYPALPRCPRRSGPGH